MAYVVSRKVMTKIPVVALRAECGVRYWEDGSIDGVADNDDNPTMPCQNGTTWEVTIDLETGVIAGWPEGVTASTHYKVCDDGRYSLLNADGEAVCTIDGYVPRIMSPKENGCGDYVIMDIGPDGKIADWVVDLSNWENADENQ